MKKFALILCLVLGGCVAPPSNPSNQVMAGPPMPPGVPPLPAPVVKKQVKALASPKAATMRSASFSAASVSAASMAATPPPSWTFVNLSGDYQIDASTNLTEWIPMVVVYSVTNLTITSDTVNKRPMLFFRVRPTN